MTSDTTRDLTITDEMIRSLGHTGTIGQLSTLGTLARAVQQLQARIAALPPEPERFTLDEARLADLVAEYSVETDHDAYCAIETAILSDDGDQAHTVIRGGCEVAVELLANGDGELDGYRMLIHPSSALDDPWIGGHVERVMDRAMLPEPGEDGGIYDTAEIIRDATAEANRLLKWSEQ